MTIIRWNYESVAVNVVHSFQRNLPTFFPHLDSSFSRISRQPNNDKASTCASVNIIHFSLHIEPSLKSCFKIFIWCLSCCTTPCNVSNPRAQIFPSPPLLLYGHTLFMSHRFQIAFWRIVKLSSAHFLFWWLCYCFRPCVSLHHHAISSSSVPSVIAPSSSVILQLLQLVEDYRDVASAPSASEMCAEKTAHQSDFKSLLYTYNINGSTFQRIRKILESCPLHR